MPRNVRNFWVDLSVDGRKDSVGTGPREKTGGMDATFYIRKDGDVHFAFDVVAREHNGVLSYRIVIPGRDDITIETVR